MIFLLALLLKPLALFKSHLVVRNQRLSEWFKNKWRLHWIQIFKYFTEHRVLHTQTRTRTPADSQETPWGLTVSSFPPLSVSAFVLFLSVTDFLLLHAQCPSGAAPATRLTRITLPRSYLPGRGNLIGTDDNTSLQWNSVYSLNIFVTLFIKWHKLYSTVWSESPKKQLVLLCECDSAKNALIKTVKTYSSKQCNVSDNACWLGTNCKNECDKNNYLLFLLIQWVYCSLLSCFLLFHVTWTEVTNSAALNCWPG